MKVKISFVLIMVGLLVTSFSGRPQEAAKPQFSPRSPDEVFSFLQSLATRFPQVTKVITLGESYGKKKIALLQLAAAKADALFPEERPAIMVSANGEGWHFLGTEAALRLAQKLVEGYGQNKELTALLEKRTIYIVPLLNPDAASSWWFKARWEKMTNDRPVDEDNDGLVDEDGPDDLNGDGLITLMRVKDTEGNWLPDSREPRLMKQADPKKGEKGIYKIYTEGWDNDGDGQYNEDPPGGVLVNQNFPHDFEYYQKIKGGWPVSEPESIALLKFMVEHPHIALVLHFSGENTILNLQQTGQARVGAERVRVPRMYATRLGLNPDQEYTLREIVEASGMVPPGVELSEEMIASFLGLGPAVSIDRQDMPLFEAVQKEYKEAITQASLDYPERRAKGVLKGSFVAYCYYQFGVPVFSTDVWAPPEPKKPSEREGLTPEKLKAMSSEDFLALGEEKIASFLRDLGAPPNFSAAAVIEMVKSGKVTPARMAEMLEKMPSRPPAGDEEHPESYLIQYSDKFLGGKGFVNWVAVRHPTLGEVEVGGFVPGLKFLPPADQAEKAISTHVDFYSRLMSRVAEVEIQEIKAKPLGEGVYEVSAFLTNPGWFPTSTAQGRRAMTSWPIRVKINLEKGQELFAGQRTELVPFIQSKEVRKVTWTVLAKKGSRLLVEAVSPKLGKARAFIILP